MCILCKNPNIKNIETLDCRDCTNLTKIPYIEGLKELWCGGCTNLIEIPDIKGLEILYCYGCTNLKKIPIISGKELWCQDCTSLTEIPVIEGLKYLYCFGCTNLTKIPIIEGLKELHCSDCTSLTSLWISQIKNTIEEKILEIEVLDCRGCPWIKQNYYYNNNIKSLKILQRWFKRTLFIKRILLILKETMPIYFHPDMKGGYFHKKDMLEFLDKI